MAPNRGWHTADPSDPMDRCRGPRAPSVDTPVDQGKGTGATPTHGGVARPKAAAVVPGQGSGGGGADHRDDHDGSCVG
jgi:hypothetical protein